MPLCATRSYEVVTSHSQGIVPLLYSYKAVTADMRTIGLKPLICHSRRFHRTGYSNKLGNGHITATLEICGGGGQMNLV